MNISINRAALDAALGLAAGVAGRRSTVDVLKCVLLEADTTTLTISASDLNVTYVSKLGCTVREPGTLALDAKGLYDIASSLSTEDVAIRAVDGRAEIRAGKSRFQVAAQPPEHFPKMPDLSALNFAKCDGPALARIVAGVAFIADSADNNPAFGGVFLDFAKSTAAAASRVRGASYTRDIKTSLDAKAFVPRGSLATMLRLADGEVEIAVSPAEMFLRAGSTVIAAKLLDADFPITTELRDKLFRVKSDHEVIVPRERFADVLRRVALCANKDINHEVRLAIKPGLASLATKSAAGMAEDEVEVGYDGAAYECGISASQIVEALDIIGGDEVTLGFSANQYEPIVLRPVAEEMGDEHVVLVQGIRRD